MLPIQMVPADRVAGMAYGAATLVKEPLVTQPTKPPDIATSHCKACEGIIYVFLCDAPLLLAPNGG
jgi:hypothetical protein